MRTRHDRVTGVFRYLWHAYLPWRYTILFYSLLLTVVVGALRRALGLNGNIHELFLAINLIAAVVPIGARKTRQLILLLLAIVFAVRVAMGWLGQPQLVPMNLALWTLVGLLATANALYFSLTARVVNREHLYAGLSAYLLAGILFGVLYWVVEQTWPGSLGTPIDTDVTLRLAIYYSFVTLTTLGYGEIVPLTDEARGLVIMESIVGQLYLAVLIARLLSLYVAAPGKGPDTSNH